jgi:hypothetical protein
MQDNTLVADFYFVSISSLSMHSRRLEIFYIKAYLDFCFNVRPFPFNPGYLTSFSAPKLWDLKIFLFKTNSV